MKTKYSIYQQSEDEFYVVKTFYFYKWSIWYELVSEVFCAPEDAFERLKELSNPKISRKKIKQYIKTL